MRIDTILNRLAFCAVFSLCCCLVSTPSLAEDFKAAKINLSEIFKGSVRMKNAEEDMRKMQFASEAKLSGLKDEITKLREQLKSDSEKLKSEEKTKIENELKEKVEELQQEQKALEVKITFKQKSLQTVMINQIRELITKIAKEDGYAVIYNTQTLLYSDGLTDLTPKITQALDAMPALEKQEKSQE